MNEKLFTNELYKEYLETLKEKVARGNIVGKKNADGTYTASVDAYDLDAFCKENNISLEKTLENLGFKKGVGSYSYNELQNIAKDYTYGTDTSGIQVDLILDEYIRSQIVMCLSKDSIHNKLTARVIPVDSEDIRITYQNKVTDSAVNLLNVGEGEELPKLDNLSFGSEVLTLGKVGGRIEFTYEYTKSTKINLLGVHYQAIADAIDNTKDANIISVIKNGHAVDATKGENGGTGRGGAIATVIPEISVQNLVPIKMWFSQYKINLEYAVMNLKTLRTILGLDEFSTPYLYETARTGKFDAFVGFKVEISDFVADNEIIAVDPNRAVEEYVYSALQSESGKDIIHQKHIKTFSETCGYSLVNPNAATVITVQSGVEYKLPELKEVEDTEAND